MLFNIDIGITGKSNGRKSLYQINMLENAGAKKIYQLTGNGTQKDRRGWNKFIQELYPNANVGVSEIGRMTRQGYDDFYNKCIEIWNRKGRVFILKYEIEITPENIENFIDEANNANDEKKDDRGWQTSKGIENQKEINKMKRIKPNTGLPIKKDIHDRIIELHLQEINNSQIAKKLNITRPTVIKYIKIYNEKCGDKGGI
jgi:DNA invertase Pin-like site-specific DNA recombinase